MLIRFKISKDPEIKTKEEVDAVVSNLYHRFRDHTIAWDLKGHMTKALKRLKNVDIIDTPETVEVHTIDRLFPLFVSNDKTGDFRFNPERYLEEIGGYIRPPKLSQLKTAYAVEFSQAGGSLSNETWFGYTGQDGGHYIHLYLKDKRCFLWAKVKQSAEEVYNFLQSIKDNK